MSFVLHDRVMFERQIQLAHLLPDGTYFDISLDHEFSIQTYSQEEARRIRASLPVREWAKSHNNCCGWWEWVGKTADDISIRIYGIADNPQGCELIYEEVETEVREPTAWEVKKKMVKRIVGTKCGEESET